MFNTKFKIPILALVAGISFYCCAQKTNTDSNNSIKYGPVPGLAEFQQMTPEERWVDSMMSKLADNVEVPIVQQQLVLDTPPPYKERQQQTGYVKYDGFAPGSAEFQGSEAGWLDSIMSKDETSPMGGMYSERQQSFQIKENRCRYELVNYKNGVVVTDSSNPADNLLKVKWGLGICLLDSNSVEIRTTSGMFSLSGFGFTIKITNNGAIRSSFWTRARHEYAFKLNDTNKLADNVEAPIIQQQLILDAPPPYKEGQQLTGYFKFKTGNYLRAFDIYNMEQSDDPHKKMDTLYTSGTIRFTCKVNMSADEDRHKYKH